MEVLIVDDEKITLRLLSRIVSSQGHTPTTFSNPVEALQAYKEFHFPIALVNWMMPEMTGIELTRKIRDIEQNRETIILIVSAFELADRSRMQEFLDSDADDYIRKPVDRQLFNIRMAIATRQAENLKKLYSLHKPE